MKKMEIIERRHQSKYERAIIAKSMNVKSIFYAIQTRDAIQNSLEM